jgi:penicillin-binding protein 2
LEPSIFFDEVNERQGVFHRRTFLLGGFAGVGALALVGRLADLQVVEGPRYSLLSKSNQFNFRIVPPPRGRILDRNGVEIASNRPDFRVLIRRDETKDVSVSLDKISAILPVTDDKKRLLAREVANTPKSTPVFIANGLSWEEFSRVNVRAPELPGISAEMGEARFYPYGGAFSHVIGYVSKVSEGELQTAEDAAGGKQDPLMHHPGFRIGKQGIEKALDLQLRGAPGGQKVEVDSTGRVVRLNADGDIKAIPGKDVVLTLDADIQNRALEVFGAESGAAVMMDCRTGDVLCMLSAPSFDANQFVGGAPSAYYRALATYDHKPLLDKALAGLYHPGSTFKTMVSLAALDNGFDPKHTYTCNGAWQFGNHTFKCDHHHGTLDMHQAIARSCDIYFFQASLLVGPDKMAQMARRFGLGNIFDIGIPGQKAGIVPDTAWKRSYFKRNPLNQKWFAGETPSMGIGQGATVVNALQLCTMASRIANGKVAVNPRLIHSVGGVIQPAAVAAPDLAIDPEHIAFVQKAMWAVCNEPGGTGFEDGHPTDLKLGNVVMAGKSGTAQDHTYKSGHGAHGAVGAWVLRDNAWFIAYAPADAPRYAMAVLVEHGGFGAGAAAPRAREIMKVALLKDPEIRARIETPLPDINAKPPPMPDASVANSGIDAPAPDPTLPGVDVGQSPT